MLGKAEIFTEIEREIRTTEEYSTSTKLYRYEEYHTQPTYRSRTEYTSNTAAENTNKKKEDFFEEQAKDEFMDTSSFKVNVKVEK